MRIERYGIPIQKGVHYGFKPVLSHAVDVHGVDGIGPDTSQYYYWITSKLYSEHLIQLRKPDFQLDVDPLFDFAYGRQFTAAGGGDVHNLYSNTRGFSLSAKIGKHVYAHTDFRENQARFPNYINHFVDSLGVVPGSGRVKEFKGDAYDFSMAGAYVGIEAADWLSINFGHGKQFVGDGYRSLLLSDNAFNYPYASYILRFGKESRWQYRYNIALMQNLDRLPAGDTPESIFKRKYMSYSYLSYKPVPRFEIGLYESVIWKGHDDTTGTEPFNFTALNPIPLVNTGVYGFDNAGANPLLGLNLAWQPLDFVRIYGQLMLDDPGSAQYGYQAGFKMYKLLSRIDLRLEYNEVLAGAYAAEVPLQGYTNSNQPLVHPYGAGFRELNAEVNYFFKRWYAAFEYSYSTYDNTGRDPLAPADTETTYTLENVSYRQLDLAYVFNPRTNMQVYFTVVNRREKSTFDSQTDRFWYIGMRTALQNIYKDF